MNIIYDKQKGKPAEWKAWSVNQDIPEMKSNLLSYLDGDIYHMQDDYTGFEVLSYRGCDTSKTWDGKYVTHWLVIDPSDPVPFKVGSSNQIEYPVAKIAIKDLSLAESRFALRETDSGEILFVDRTALITIGRFLDCSMAFMGYKEFDSLGLCIQLSQAISLKGSVNLVVKNTEYGKIILGMVGADFKIIDQRDFFNSVFRFMSSLGTWDIVSWQAAPSVAEVYIEQQIGSCRLNRTRGLYIQTPEVNGCYTICPYIRIYDSICYLDKISLSRNYYEGLIDSVIERLLPIMSEPFSEYDVLDNPVDESDYIEAISVMSSYGKKEKRRMSSLVNLNGSAMDLIESICSVGTGKNIHQKRADNGEALMVIKNRLKQRTGLKQKVM